MRRPRQEPPPIRGGSSADAEPPADDETLVRACRAGDEAAWREIVTRYGRLVFSIPRRYGLDPEASEDVFQEVFSILVQQLPAIQNPTGLPKWLITTTHRVSCRAIRSARGKGARVQDGVDPGAPPPEEALRWERQHLVREGLRRLGGRCEELLTALYLDHEHVSYRHIARRLGMPVGSIGPTRARCLGKLMEILRTAEGDRVL
ncbi:MAG: sigma-70 family RNA polymerase sigma factor [Planctomycetota bacterium]|nr:sigma-70 family RNA polymerase sigma factor [Planctomycetota bacterium]